jgi:hypothetical protein
LRLARDQVAQYGSRLLAHFAARAAAAAQLAVRSIEDRDTVVVGGP